MSKLGIVEEGVSGTCRGVVFLRAFADFAAACNWAEKKAKETDIGSFYVVSEVEAGEEAVLRQAVFHDLEEDDDESGCA